LLGDRLKAFAKMAKMGSVTTADHSHFGAKRFSSGRPRFA
jgi:hypothetical protein